MFRVLLFCAIIALPEVTVPPVGRVFAACCAEEGEFCHNKDSATPKINTDILYDESFKTASKSID
jgi:hypothetical protein